MHACGEVPRTRGAARVRMYQFSRAIYRELARDDRGAAPVARCSMRARRGPAGVRGHGRAPGQRPPLLRAAGRTLFNDIRTYFPMSAAGPRLPDGRRAYLALAEEWLDAPAAAAASTSTATRCSAAPRRARGRPASACRSRTTATARRTSTSPRPRRCRRAGRGLAAGGGERSAHPVGTRSGGRAYSAAHAAGRRRRRNLHRRRARRSTAARHGQGADDARRPVAGRDGCDRRRARAGRRAAPATSARSPTA